MICCIIFVFFVCCQLDQIKEQQRLLQSEHEECNDLVDKQQRSNEALVGYWCVFVILVNFSS